MRYIVKSFIVTPAGRTQELDEEYCLDFAQADMRATELMLGMTDISCLDWQVAIYDNGDIVSQWAMDDAQPLYDHRVAMVTQSNGERVDQHGVTVQDGFMFVGHRDNLDVVLHNIQRRKENS